MRKGFISGHVAETCLVRFVVLLCLAEAGARAAGPNEFTFQHENVLGTSLELIVRTSTKEKAWTCDQTVLGEIHRLSDILNTYQEGTEIRRLEETPAAVKCSPELIEVLTQCQYWQKKSQGAFDARLGAVIQLWKEAQKAGHLPDRERLAKLVAEMNRTTYEIDETARTVRHLGNARLNVDALAKGYIVDKAVEVAVKIPAIDGMLLNIGGDIRVWTAPGKGTAEEWQVGVADADRSYDNEPTRIRVHLTNAGIATSGGYARNYKIGTKTYSHILNPQTGWPCDGTSSVTVVAHDCMTADALATALSVLGPQKGQSLAESIPDVDCLIVAADGTIHTSRGWAKRATLVPNVATSPVPTQWPDGYHVTFVLTLKSTFFRPYVAIWIEDQNGQCIKPLTVWGKDRQYLKRMTSWWRHAGKDPNFAQSVTRASRSGGTYTLVWDGTDERGRPVPRGTYVVRLELQREKSKRFDLKGAIECDSGPATGGIPDSPEVTNMFIRYAREGD
jgi:thiamine biosynthesis lipoprotein